MPYWKFNFIVFSFMFLCSAQDKTYEKTANIQDIIEKIYNISSDALDKADSNERETILDSIEKKLKESSLNYGDKSDRYVHIIMHGVKALIADKHTRRDSRKQGQFDPFVGILDHVDNINVNRIASKDAVDNIATKMLRMAHKNMKESDTNEVRDQNIRRTKNIQVEINSLDRNFEEKKPAVNFDVHKETNYGMQTTTASKMLYASTPFKSCDATIKETCEDIQALQYYKCSGKMLPLNILCDGHVDCHDNSDEVNCLDQAMKTLHKITDVLTHLETYILQKCFVSSDNTILIKQKEILENVLHTQRSNLGMFSVLNLKEEVKEMKEIERTSHEVVSLLQTIATALNGSLCMNELPDRNKINASSELQIFDDDIISRKLPLQQCKCKNEFCSDSSCSDSCKLVCWYKYSLARWSCHAIDETTSISLGKICDGKLDCYDESDEAGCNTGSVVSKFEANAIYDKILKMIELKGKSNKYSFVYKKLMLFYNSVKLLQKTMLTKDIDQLALQHVRDQCFSTLLSIYEDILESSAFVGDLDDPHMFLQSVNEKLVSALKRSYVIHNKIARQAGCLCKNGACIVQNCPRYCQRACEVRPLFTRYLCKDSATNMSIPIDWVCNSRQDCQFQDDEGQCKTDVCRTHHLTVVQDNLRSIGDGKKITSLGEILKDWRNKAITMLKAAEKEFRPTLVTFRGIIGDILNELVMTYSSVEEGNYRRINDDIYFKSFLKVSQEVIEYLKLCSQ